MGPQNAGSVQMVGCELYYTKLLAVAHRSGLILPKPIQAHHIQRFQIPGTTLENSRQQQAMSLTRNE